MPPKCKFTKEKIIHAALEITRADGFKAVTARAVGIKLNSSSKVIFSLFQNMEELHSEVIIAASKIYQCYLQEDMAYEKYPPYKACGMAYIRFAKEEKELFKLLFMRDRSEEQVSQAADEIKPFVELIQKNTGLSEQEAYVFHMEMWVYVHGIATMLATNYLEWDWALISKMLTDSYEGLKKHYSARE